MNGSFGGGNGTIGSPYIIQDAQDLAATNNFLTSFFVLGNDIDCSSYGTAFTPIGGGTSFKGTLDGAGHKITNLKIRTASSNIALFRNVQNATIKNLVIESPEIVGTDTVAVLIATNARNGATYANVDNVSIINASVTASGANVGLIVGLSATDCSIANSTATGTIVSTAAMELSYTGGLVGSAIAGYPLSLTNNTVDITINSNGGSIGGMVGAAQYATISNCRVMAQISTACPTNAYVGGIFGRAAFASNSYSINISNVRVSGSLYAEGAYVGGAIGYMTISTSGTLCTITACGVDVDVQGTARVGGFIGSAAGTAGAFSVSKCFSLGTVRATTGDYCGGFAGESIRLSIQNSYSTCDVIAAVNTNSGGFIGSLGGTQTITNCYFCGTIVVGKGFGGTISGTLATCVNNITKGISQTVTGLVNKTDAECMSKSTFDGQNWDFVNIWSMIVYPQLYDLPEDDRYGITGIITRDGVPVQGAKVILFGKDRLYSTVLSDADGKYTFLPVLPEKDFTVVATYNDGSDIYVSLAYPEIMPVVLP